MLKYLAITLISALSFNIHANTNIDSTTYEWSNKTQSELPKHFLNNNIFVQGKKTFDIIKLNNKHYYIKYFYDPNEEFLYDYNIYAHLKYIIITQDRIYIPLSIREWDFYTPTLNNEPPIDVIKVSKNKSIKSNDGHYSSSSRKVVLIFKNKGQNELILQFKTRNLKRSFKISTPNKKKLHTLFEEYDTYLVNYDYKNTLKFLTNKLINSDIKKPFIITKKYKTPVKIFADSDTLNEKKPYKRRFIIKEISHTSDETIITLKNNWFYEDIYIGQYGHRSPTNRAFRLNGKPFKYFTYKGKKYYYNPNSYQSLKTEEGDTITYFFERDTSPTATLVDNDFKTSYKRSNKFENFDLHQPGSFVVIEPSPPKFLSPHQLQKGEFEKTADFKKRVLKEEQITKRINQKNLEEYQKKLKQFKQQLETARLKYAEYEKWFESPERIEHLKQKYMPALTKLALGLPMIKYAQYDADTEKFIVSVSSSAINPQLDYKEPPLLLKEHDVIFTDFKDIDFLHSYIALKAPNGFPRYAYDLCWQKETVSCQVEQGNSLRFFNYGGVRPNKNVKISITTRKNIEDKKRQQIFYFDDKKITIIRDNFKPAFEQDLSVPVPIKYAKKFKHILLEENFTPTLSVTYKNGTLTINSVMELEDPIKQVQDRQFKQSFNSIAKLKNFIKEHPKSSLISQAKRRIQKLQYNQAKYDINKLKKFLASCTKNCELRPEAQLQLQELELQQAYGDHSELEKLIKKYKTGEVVEKAKQRITKLKELEAQKKAQLKKYLQKKSIGQTVCQQRHGFFGMLDYTVKAQVENLNGDKIRLHILDTENQSPSYKGIILYPGVYLWDRFDNWMVCD